MRYYDVGDSVYSRDTMLRMHLDEVVLHWTNLENQEYPATKLETFSVIV